MIADTVNRVLFSLDPSESDQLLTSLPPHDLRLTVVQVMECLCTREKIDSRDLSILEVTARHFSGTNNVTDKELFHCFRLADRIALWIAMTKGYNKNELSQKTRVYFLKHIVKTPKLWHYQRLERFALLIASKDQKLGDAYNQGFHLNELTHIQYVMEFFQSNPRYLPANFDFRDILAKYVCINRMETKSEKVLLGLTINRLFVMSSQGVFHSTFRYCFQFYRYPYDEKTSPYKPVLPIFEVIKRLPFSSLSSLIENSFLGLIWNSQNYTIGIKNCVNAGIVPNTLLLIQKIKESALKNNAVQALVSVLESDILKAFIYLKFQQHFCSSLELLQMFVLGAPTRLKVYEKLLVKTKNVMFSVPERFRQQFYTFLQGVKAKYQQFCDVKELQELLDLQSGKGVFALLSKEELKTYLKQFDWVCLTALVKSGSSQLKGLYNIGNSCYMNSFVQALYMTREFRLQILSIDILQKQREVEQKFKIKAKESADNAKRIRDQLMPLFEFQKLCALLYKSNRPCINPSFFKTILPANFRNSFQQDTAEFGRIFLSVLDQVMGIAFEGIGEVSVECLACRHKRSQPDKFLDVILSCEQKQAKLPSLLQQINHPEVLEDVYCEKCDKKALKSVRQHNIKQLPNYAILTFNRFAYDVALNKKVKLNFKVPLEQNINLPYILESGEGKFQQYQLYAIIVHRGVSAESGHYYTFAKQSLEEESRWLCLNDSSVTQLQTLTKVAEFLQGSPEDTPYVLFYQNKAHVAKIREDKSYTSPFLLSQRLRGLIQKQDLQFIKTLQKPKFNLPKINFNYMDFFKKDDDQDGGGPDNNRLIM